MRKPVVAQSAARTGVACVLVVTLSVACVPGVLALAQENAETRASGAAARALESGQSSATFEKTEVVYASLDAKGTPQAVYVVNRFEVSEPGVAVDAGAYGAVENLTDQRVLAQADDAVAFEADEGLFFYQGTLDEAQLPWTVGFSFELDGRAVSPDELAGASGALCVRVHTARNDAVAAEFFESYMMQITFTLPGDAARSVAAPGATVASSGSDRTVAFTVLPGHEGDFELTAQVENFHMDGVQVVALPYESVVEMPDADGLTDGMDALASAVGQLSDGTSQLAAGADELAAGADELAAGSSAYGEGMRALAASSDDMVSASAQINGALATVSGALESADLAKLEQLGALPEKLRELADAVEALGDVSGEAVAAYAQAFASLRSPIDELSVSMPTDAEISALRASVADDEEQVRTADKLAATCAAARSLVATYGYLETQLAAGEQDADGAQGGIDGAFAAQLASQLRAWADSLEANPEFAALQGIPQLAEGMRTLAAQYALFHDGLKSYTDGVTALAGGYGQLSAGTAAAASGADALAAGADALADGAGALDDAVVTLPETMRREMEELMADYEFPAYTGTSFAAPDADKISGVQFVMTTAAIELPETEEEPEEEQELTLWDRLLALFQSR